MEDNILLVIRSDALPDVYHKVLQIKEMLQSDPKLTASEAIKRVGISRSAFYKYRDSVYSYSELSTTGISTLNFTLRDEPGALSQVIATISSFGGNILTVNQNVPTMGLANVTVSIAHSQDFAYKEFLSAVAQLNVVVSVTPQSERM